MDILINIFTYPNPYGETTETMEAYVKNFNGYSAVTYMMMLAYAAYVFLHQDDCVEEDTEEEVSETEDEKGIHHHRCKHDVKEPQSKAHMVTESDDDDTEEDPDYILGDIDGDDDEDDDEPGDGGPHVDITASSPFLDYATDMNVSPPINCY